MPSETVRGAVGGVDGAAPPMVPPPERVCFLCPKEPRNRRPKKVLKRCYDALDADEWVGPVLLDGKDTTPKHAHQACALWCPEVYFDARMERLRKLETAMKRAKQMPCAWCKLKGAAIGCGIEECPRSYHLTCAHEANCSFAQSEFMLACPRHVRRLATERADARWQDVGVEEAEQQQQTTQTTTQTTTTTTTIGFDSGSAGEEGLDVDRVMTGAGAGPSVLATGGNEAQRAVTHAPGATPILNRIRAAAEEDAEKRRKQRRGGSRKRIKMNDEKFMNTREGAIYQAVMEAGARLNAEKDKVGGIADDEEAFRLRESRRFEKDKSEIPRVVVGGGMGVSAYSQGWESLAGMEEHVKTLKEMTLLPLAYPEMFETLGAGAARGVLLHGPPGTGKTAAVRAMLGAAARGPRPISFFSRLGADCLGKYSGEAERKLRLLFEEAEKHQPSIIFFDEIDGLAPARRGGGGASGAQDEIHSSVVATLLALMDGLSGRGSVVVVASTNRPDAVDAALRRPGRFDRELFFGLPDARARADILGVHTRAWTPAPTRATLEAVAARTEGCAGADLRAIANAALMSALQRTCPSLLKGDPTRDSLAVELESRLPPPPSAEAAMEEARVESSRGRVGASLSLEQFEALGKRIRVYWPLEDVRHDATIVGYDRNTVSHRIQYDDSNIFNGEEKWMQLFRSNVNVESLPMDPEIDNKKLSTRIKEAQDDALKRRDKYRESRRDGITVASRDWTHALTTTSSACSARTAAAALVPRGRPIESYLYPVLGESVRQALYEFIRRGAPVTPRCAVKKMAFATRGDVEGALVAAGAVDVIRDGDDDGDRAEIDALALAPNTPPSNDDDETVVDEPARRGCRLLVAGEPGNGQREIVDVLLNALSGTSTHLISLTSLIACGDGDAYHGVGPALLEPLRQATRTKTTLIMPDLELWALAQTAEPDGETLGVTTSALWDLVQSTISDCYAASSSGEGGLYVVASVNLPSEAIPDAVEHFFACAGALVDVDPSLDADAVERTMRRAAEHIADVDVPAVFAEARSHVAARFVASEKTPEKPLEDDEESREAACEALRIRVRRSRAVVRAAIAKCTHELLKTRKFDRFFDNCAQASRLIDLALDRKIGDPNRFVRDLRACAKAMKPRKNTATTLHKPLVSLGFNAVDTLESWLHLGVRELYEEYAARDEEYDAALAESAKATNNYHLPGVSTRNPEHHEAGDDDKDDDGGKKAAAKRPSLPTRRSRDDVIADAYSALSANLAVAKSVEDIRKSIDAARLRIRDAERHRVLSTV